MQTRETTQPLPLWMLKENGDLKEQKIWGGLQRRLSGNPFFAKRETMLVRDVGKRASIPQRQTLRSDDEMCRLRGATFLSQCFLKHLIELPLHLHISRGRGLIQY